MQRPAEEELDVFLEEDFVLAEVGRRSHDISNSFVACQIKLC